MSNIVVAALYHFVPLDKHEDLREPLIALGKELGVKGTLLLASEGINGTIAGSREAIDTLLGWLREDPRLAGLSHKESFCTLMPFYRYKVRLKKEIVTMGVPGVDPNEVVGHYVEPEDWNELISDPDVLLIDTRNDYEIHIGTFQGAVDPNIKTFRAFPEYMDNLMEGESRPKKVAMFCTGGIRCEKATSYMRKQGFDEVYHLKGGILKYLERVPEEQSMWDGACFVFDNRVAVGHGLHETDHTLCFACREPLSEEDRASADYEEGAYCPKCKGRWSEERLQAFRERHHQVQLAIAEHRKHLGEERV